MCVRLYSSTHRITHHTEELMTPEEIDQKGDWVWLPHETEAFVPARVISPGIVQVEGETGQVCVCVRVCVC
jgi:hypothetical protein